MLSFSSGLLLFERESWILVPFECGMFPSSSSIVVRTWKGLLVKLLSGMIWVGVEPVCESLSFI